MIVLYWEPLVVEPLGILPDILQNYFKQYCEILMDSLRKYILQFWRIITHIKNITHKVTYNHLEMYLDRWLNV